MENTVPDKGPVERLLHRDGFVVAGALAALVLLAGLYTVAGVGMPMTALDMTRMARPIGEPMAMGLQPVWTAQYAILMFFMWWIMMIAMMTPGAAPLVLLFVAIKRTGPDAHRVRALSALLLGGYLVAWAGFSVGAVVLQWAVERLGAASGAMMTLEGRWIAGLVLLAAGLYQFTGLKTACLRHCRSPGQFLADHRRPGAGGAFRMGVDHGVYCLGCCWVLMALLFVGGVMNLYWIVGLTAYVLLEKFAPRGDLVAKVAGAALIVLGTGYVLTS